MQRRRTQKADNLQFWTTGSKPVSVIVFEAALLDFVWWELKTDERGVRIYCLRFKADSSVLEGQRDLACGSLSPCLVHHVLSKREDLSSLFTIKDTEAWANQKQDGYFCVCMVGGGQGSSKHYADIIPLQYK